MSKESKNPKVEEGKKEQKNLFKMTIVVKEDGTVGFSLDAEKDENLPDPIKLIGLLEVVKADVMQSTSTTQAGAQKEEDFVEVTLEEEDFELPQADQLRAMEKKVGDKVMLPKPIAFAREAIIGEMKAEKNAGKSKETKEAGDAKVVPLGTKGADA